MSKYKLALTAALLAIAYGAHAQVYPTKSIRLVVPSTPGGSVDALARTIGPKLAERWGQQVIVDNRPGAGGAIAAELVARSAPDGYSLIFGTIAALATNVSLRRSLPYHPIKDFAPVSLVATQNMMLLIHPSVPARSVKELIQLAKARPGALSFAAPDAAGGHLSGELFKLLAGIDLLYVPYKGVAQALLDVVSGQTSMAFPSILSALPQVRANKLRALAVTGAKRSAVAPELPTMQEAGVKGYESVTWYGVLAPIATPRDVVAKLNTEIVAILRSHEVAQRLSTQGADPVGTSPEDFGKFIESEIEKWRKVIRSAGIQPG